MISEQSKTPIKVRKVGHVVYEVSDVERSTSFWTDVMGFAVSDRNERGMVFLTACGDHHSIALVPAAGKRKPDHTALQIHHWAMEVESVEGLFKAREFLKSRGVPLSHEGRRGPGDNIGLEFQDPDGYTIEIYCDMDQIEESSAARPQAQWRRATSLEDAIKAP